MTFAYVRNDVFVGVDPSMGHVDHICLDVPTREKRSKLIEEVQFAQTPGVGNQQPETSQNELKENRSDLTLGSTRVVARIDVAKESREPVASCANPVHSNNVGFKLLKAMGWREGSGLGKQQQGIVEPVGKIYFFFVNIGSDYSTETFHSIRRRRIFQIISEIRVWRAGLGASNSIRGRVGERPTLNTMRTNKREEVLPKSKQRDAQANRRTD